MDVTLCEGTDHLGLRESLIEPDDPTIYKPEYFWGFRQYDKVIDTRSACLNKFVDKMGVFVIDFDTCTYDCSDVKVRNRQEYCTQELAYVERSCNGFSEEACKKQFGCDRQE